MRKFKLSILTFSTSYEELVGFVAYIDFLFEELHGSFIY